MSVHDDLVPILKKLRMSGVLQSLELRTKEATDDDLKAENETEKRFRLAMVHEMVASELANTKALLELWENSTIDFMPINAFGETMHEYGPNFGEDLQKKITLMEEYGDRPPYIDPNYMWRMPTGSPIDAAEYIGY